MSRSDIPRLLRSLTSEPLAIEKGTLISFASIIRRRGLEGLSFNGAELHSELQIATPRARTNGSSDPRIAVIPLEGTIANRAQSLGTGASEFAAEVTAAAADPRVDAIALLVDSPGGTVTGVPEAAEAVFQARQAKPVGAFNDGLMASAGYWIGAAADEVWAKPSSDTGSIGVFMTHEDWSQAIEAEGVIVTEIAAGKFKTEGAPWKELDAEAEEFLKSRVTEVYGWFVNDVARFRGETAATVRNGFGEGRVLGAKQSKAEGLIDHIGSFDDMLAKLSAKAAARPDSRAAAARAMEVDRVKAGRR